METKFLLLYRIVFFQLGILSPILLFICNCLYFYGETVPQSSFCFYYFFEMPNIVVTSIHFLSSVYSTSSSVWHIISTFFSRSWGHILFLPHWKLSLLSDLYACIGMPRVLSLAFSLFYLNFSLGDLNHSHSSKYHLFAVTPESISSLIFPLSSRLT